MAQQQRSPYEEFFVVGIILGIIIVIGWTIWYAFHRELTEVLRWIRLGEMWAVAQIAGDNYTVDVPGIGVQELKTWRNWLPHAPVANIQSAELHVMTWMAVPPLRYVFAALLFLMALAAALFSPGTRFHRRMNLEALIRAQAESFPVVRPFIKFNPAKMPVRVPGDPVPAELPLFAEALSPEEWAAFHRIPFDGKRLEINAAWQALGRQLGRRWQGPLKLAPHAQLLYAAFALRHARRRKESEDLLNEAAGLWTPERGLHLPLKLRLRVRSILLDSKLGGALQKYTDQHAFETTALLRALARAREEGGVLAPATFLWLRGHDRALWYPLNNLGRKAYHAEAAGALVHYMNELIAGQKIPTPRFEDVIKTMEAYLTGPDARPIPPLNTTARAGKTAAG